MFTITIRYIEGTQIPMYYTARLLAHGYSYEYVAPTRSAAVGWISRMWESR